MQIFLFYFAANQLHRLLQEQMGSNRRDYSLEQRKKMADSQSNKRDEFHDRRKKRDETEILKNLDEYAKRNSHLEPLEPPRNVLQSKLTRYEKESL